jgi:hypothetical protein
MEKYYHGSKNKVKTKYLEPRPSRVIEHEKFIANFIKKTKSNK